MAHRISISGGACLLLALMLLFLPLQWVAAALLAAAVHEAGHLAAIFLLGGHVHGVEIGMRGALIRVGEMGRGAELACALAGPLAGASMLLFAGTAPRLALCALIHTAYNLLPMYPLDGGRVLACAAALLWQPLMAQRVCRWVAMLCGCALLVFGIWLWWHLGMGILPLVGTILVIYRSIAEKFLAKRRN